MSNFLDVFGLVCLAVGAFLLALWLGFIVLGAACLLASYSLTRRKSATATPERGRLVRAA